LKMGIDGYLNSGSYGNFTVQLPSPNPPFTKTSTSIFDVYEISFRHA